AREWQRPRAADRITCRHRNWERIAATGGEVHIVVDELPPDVAVIGQTARVDDAEIIIRIVRVRLVVKDIADQAADGVARQRRGANTVAKCVRIYPEQVSAGHAPGRVADVIARLVDRAEVSGVKETPYISGPADRTRVPRLRRMRSKCCCHWTRR